MTNPPHAQALAGPFDASDPRVAVLADDYSGDVAAWLHDNAVQCENCRQFWLCDEPDAPNDNASEDKLCEACADDVEADDALGFYRNNLRVFL